MPARCLWAFKPSLAVVIATALSAGCSKPSPEPDLPAPTAFFDWCVRETFGIRSSQQAMVHSNSVGTNSPIAVIGSADFTAWTPCKTGEEAGKYLESTVSKLKRGAQEKGISL